jgi:sorbose reductase
MVESTTLLTKKPLTILATRSVTGGAGTLALESARALLEHGLSGLALWDISFIYAADPIASLQADFPSVAIETVIVDVRESKSVDDAMKTTIQKLGSVNVLCCFAGVVSCGPSVDVGVEEWRRVLDINCTGGFLCAQVFARFVSPFPTMMFSDQELILKNSQVITQRTGGSIVFISSLSAHVVNFPQPQPAYNVSKAGLSHLTHCLAAEWAVHGIRVNSISPGYMDTILNEGDGLERARGLWNERNPIGRMGSASELQGPLILLCSSAGSFINGADLRVDGGASVF